MRYTFYIVWNGETSQCFSTIQAARTYVKQLVSDGYSAEIEKVTTGDVNKRLIMTLIESNGGGWCAKSEIVE